MTSPITTKACEAWFLLEAADLRGLPAPVAVHVRSLGTELCVRTGAEFDRWVDALHAEPTTYDTGGMVQRTVTGELHEMPVTVFVVETAGVTA